MAQPLADVLALDAELVQKGIGLLARLEETANPLAVHVQAGYLPSETTMTIRNYFELWAAMAGERDHVRCCGTRTGRQA